LINPVYLKPAIFEYSMNMLYIANTCMRILVRNYLIKQLPSLIKYSYTMHV
jgi:hypothetical protein